MAVASQRSGPEGRPSGTGTTTAAGRTASVRPGDEQVVLYLAEYVRLRDAARAGEGAPTGPARSALQEKIALHYTGLVESVARRFTRFGEPLEDLVQEGFLGLLSALDNYDPTKGVKFSTYATHFIAGAMRHCLRDRGKIIKEPAWLQELGNKISRVSDALTQRLGRTPSAGEIAHVLNLTEESIEEVLSARQVFQVASFDSDPDSDAAGLVDPEKIKSDKYVTLQLPIEDRILIENAVEKLKALEQKVLYYFFYKELNQTEIARKLGISCNYAAHILKNSTKKLRRILGEAEVKDRSRIRETSIVDGATGLYTAAHIRGRMEEEVSRASRGNYPLAVVTVELIDLPRDLRRRDEVLAACGNAVRECIRRVDIAGRLTPGEGILILLPHTGTAADVVVERLTESLRAIAQEEPEPFLLRVVLVLFPDQGRTAQALLNAAHCGEDDPPIALAAA